MTKRENVYLTEYPHILSEWHPTKNGNLDPAKIPYGSNRRMLWRCSLGHEWEARVSNRTIRRSGCPYCSGRRAIPGETCLESQRPDLVKEWSPKNDRGPGDVSVGSKFRAIWVCTEHSHEWAAVVSDRTRRNGCPVCAGQRTLAGFNCVATTHPELVEEWSPKNDRGPSKVTVSSGYKAIWICSAHGHEWAAVVNARTRGNGCPKCCLTQTSKIEGELYRLLSEHFPDSEQGVRIGRWSVDVLFSEEKVVVEYDGAYFHRDRVAYDTRKTLDLLERGYRVVRIRERSGKYALPSLDIKNPHYLELTYNYSKDWSGLSDVVSQITSWVSGSG